MTDLENLRKFFVDYVPRCQWCDAPATQQRTWSEEIRCDACALTWNNAMAALPGSHYHPMHDAPLIRDIVASIRKESTP